MHAFFGIAWTLLCLGSFVANAEQGCYNCDGQDKNQLSDEYKDKICIQSMGDLGNDVIDKCNSLADKWIVTNGCCTSSHCYASKFKARATYGRDESLVHGDLYNSSEHLDTDTIQKLALREAPFDRVKSTHQLRSIHPDLDDWEVFDSQHAPRADEGTSDLMKRQNGPACCATCHALRTTSNWCPVSGLTIAINVAFAMCAATCNAQYAIVC